MTSPKDIEHPGTSLWPHVDVEEAKIPEKRSKRCQCKKSFPTVNVTETTYHWTGGNNEELCNEL